MNNPSMLVLVFFVLAMLSPASLWKTPPSLGREKRPAEGFYHRLPQLWRRVVLAAAWWYCCISGVAGDVHDFFFTPLWRRGHPKIGMFVANFFEMRLLPLVSFQWLAWLIARDYLQAKWQAELDEQNRIFYRDRADKWGQS
jgi:hypothetical protein